MIRLLQYAFGSVGVFLLLTSSLPLCADLHPETLKSISTPDKVDSSIGTLEFRDGAPYPQTAEKLYDYLDHMRAVDSFLKGIQGASVHALMKGEESLALSLPMKS
ncbi:hypothetical protein QT397_12875 [Microbulbifer sp. MKSA007]|nr:hypothetical protein QT397_12875 [Microbulbifer sp. MKSA007]